MEKIEWPYVVDKDKLNINNYEISKDASELIHSLLKRKPEDRPSIDDIKKFKFFYDIDFATVRKSKPIHVPAASTRTTTKYFDKSRIKEGNLMFTFNNSKKESSKEKDKLKSKNNKFDIPEIQIKLDFTSNDGGKKKFPELNTSFNLSVQEDTDDLFNRRDDLLHKRNLECFNEIFKKNRAANLNIEIDDILDDMNLEDI